MMMKLVESHVREVSVSPNQHMPSGTEILYEIITNVLILITV